MRDKIATLLWCDCPIDQSRKHLRHALWQLQKSLSAWPEPFDDLILTEADWMQINPKIGLWMDAIEFERAYIQVRGQEGHLMQDNQACSLQAAVNLYTADLLENCHDEWCLLERERFQHMYMASLDKLIAFHEQRGEYDVGIEQGLRSLSHNPVRERTYRQLMKLYCLNGDRLAALRLFAICETILNRELMVEPSKQTVEQYQQIRDGKLDRLLKQSPTHANLPPINNSNSSELLRQLHGFQTTLAKMQQQVEDYIKSLEQPIR